MTLVLDTPAPALPNSNGIGDRFCITYGGEFCPSDQKLIDACTRC